MGLSNNNNTHFTVLYRSNRRAVFVMVSMVCLSAVLSPLLYILIPAYAPGIGEMQRQYLAIAGLIPGVLGIAIGTMWWTSVPNQDWSLRLAETLSLYDQRGRCRWKIALRDLHIYELIITMQSRHASFCIAFSDCHRLHKFQRQGFRSSSPCHSDFSVDSLSSPKSQLDESSYQQLLSAVLVHGIHPTKIARSPETWGDPAMRKWVARRVWFHRVTLALGIVVVIMGVLISLKDCL